jgi:tight adherence protein B
MVIPAVVALWSAIGVALFFLLRASMRRDQAIIRLNESQRGSGLELEANAVASSDSAVGMLEQPLHGVRRLSRHWIWVPWAFGFAIAATAWLVFRWPFQYVCAIGAVIALLLSQLEGFVYARHIANLERQLADAIDIMVGAVSAGAAVGPAIDAAAYETERPLKPFLEELSARIRLGDEPRFVFESLADRVPVETFLLFSSSLAVHYEVGGRLAPTLATVGRTIRDRIEVTRRIQSNIAQSQFSTFAILGLIYLIAAIVWRNGPEPMREFVTSSVGGWFVAGSIILQAVGIAWMNLISKPRF